VIVIVTSSISLTRLIRPHPLSGSVGQNGTAQESFGRASHHAEVPGPKDIRHTGREAQQPSVGTIAFTEPFVLDVITTIGLLKTEAAGGKALSSSAR
jgi:hypothetical protein